MQLADAVARWLLTNGIGQNLVASAILAPPAAVWAHRKFVRPLREDWREHRQRVRELHELLVQKESSREPTHP